MISTAGAAASKPAFLSMIGSMAAAIGERPLDADLAEWLNRAYPATGAEFRRIAELMAAGAREGWLCQREAGGVAFGRVVKPGAETGRFSVDVVRMEPVAGPHHIHPNGEIGLIASVTDAFCGDCSRIRLTADGQIRTCLFSTQEYDVRELLRSGGSRSDVTELIRFAVARKEFGHKIGSSTFTNPSRPMSSIGG